MSKIRLRDLFAPSLVLLLLCGFSACGHKEIKPEESLSPADAAVKSSDDGSQSSDQGNAHGLQTIHFGYDANTLSAEAKAILKANARILVAHPTLRIQVEGHCDQRGGIQYNIALGERRAVSAKHFLEDQGIAAGRITTVSFGKERPVDSAETEEAYAKNRRANFVLTKPLS